MLHVKIIPSKFSFETRANFSAPQALAYKANMPTGRLASAPCDCHVKGRRRTTSRQDKCSSTPSRQSSLNAFGLVLLVSLFLILISCCIILCSEETQEWEVLQMLWPALVECATHPSITPWAGRACHGWEEDSTPLTQSASQAGSRFSSRERLEPTAFQPSWQLSSPVPRLSTHSPRSFHKRSQM